MNTRAARLPPDTVNDTGFSLIETLVAIGIIATVMASMAAFYVRGTSVSEQQRNAQAAVRFATTAMEQVHLLNATAVLSGRTQTAVNSQWVAPGVSAYLAATVTAPTWSTDPAIPGMSLPTTPQQVTIAGANTIFQESWYVGGCWAQSTGATCSVVAAALRPTLIPMYRVIVAITWPDAHCAANLCSLVTVSLLPASTTDPTFD